ncbi:MerR family transcriptional regulator [Actinophytocola algeriensis]|uniref:Protein phosphatase n=1 Tax=Actinophytocola algeriensis TaxID=1768010 RepID=A0A7W7VIX7_9PSEU|nr:MerR family transcriptional regulator [Actinophytocola algeriensis]MBB4911908.1 protein phosphatase [Actinophytocola algeriensis]MBE1477600.1 protein phosphatase [Actinophytocola algeriensis]
MELLTIGEFARASRLSAKALRLYDELGLLRPAVVDPFNGYRRYSPDQLETARVVAWLRRIGMPLAEIRAVVAMPGDQAAEAVAGYWRQVEADTDDKRQLAAVLVEYLSGKGVAVSTSLAVKYAVRTDRGLVRSANQDFAFAGEKVFAVADGFGHHGTRASRAAVEAVRQVAVGDLLNAMDDAARSASEAVQGLDDSGTTLTALIWEGSQLGLVHIGDSRAYLLRDGELFQITHDDTVVQSMVDEGKLMPEEVASHPRRAILLKALTGGVSPGVQVRDVQAGDRYLLSSDGLHTVLDLGTIRRVLADEEPQEAVDRLVRLANEAGGPDNISCVVAHLIAQ